MANVYFKAKLAWETGHRRDAFMQLEGYFREHIGQVPVFLLPEHVVDHPAPGSFETAVWILLTGTVVMSSERLLKAPLGRVLPRLLALDPYQRWIDVLVDYDFFAAPSEIGRAHV